REHGSRNRYQCRSSCGVRWARGVEVAGSEIETRAFVAATGSRATPLRLERIETIPIRVPLARTYRGSAYEMTHRSTLIVRLHTSAGVVGEAYVGDEDAALGEIDRIVLEEIAPRLIVEDLFAIERLWQLARPSTFDILRDRRLGLVACAGIDTAAWDAIGKALGQPLWRLWGGYRNSISMIS